MLRHHAQLTGFAILQEEHAALRVELFDDHAHGALSQLVEIRKRVQQPADSLEQAALATRRQGLGRPLMVLEYFDPSRQGLLAASPIAEAFERRCGVLEP
jgi:hypothetical protein